MTMPQLILVAFLSVFLSQLQTVAPQQLTCSALPCTACRNVRIFTRICPKFCQQKCSLRNAPSAAAQRRVHGNGPESAAKELPVRQPSPSRPRPTPTFRRPQVVKTPSERRVATPRTPRAKPRKQPAPTPRQSRNNRVQPQRGNRRSNAAGCPRADFKPCTSKPQANKKVMACCRKVFPRTTHPECFNLCTVSQTVNTITHAFNIRQKCGLNGDQLYRLFHCVTGGYDHTGCCLTKNVDRMCLKFCNPPEPFTVGLEGFLCNKDSIWGPISECYHSGFN